MLSGSCRILIGVSEVSFYGLLGVYKGSHLGHGRTWVGMAFVGFCSRIFRSGVATGLRQGRGAHRVFEAPSRTCQARFIDAVLVGF